MTMIVPVSQVLTLILLKPGRSRQCLLHGPVLYLPSAACTNVRPFTQVLPRRPETYAGRRLRGPTHNLQ
jgi:hypothetical protein